MLDKFDLTLLSKENKALFEKEYNEFISVRSDDERPSPVADYMMLRTLYVYYLLKSIDKYCIGGKVSYDLATCKVDLSADIIEFDDMGKFAEAFGLADEILIQQQTEDAVRMEFGFNMREI